MRTFFLLILFSLGLIAQAQDMIRFSGVVLDKVEYKPVAGISILNETSGGGAMTDSLGFFTVKARPGDTLIFSDVRYLSSLFVIPEVLDESDYGIIQVLTENKTLPDEMQVYSFPSEEEFIDAFMDVTPKPDMQTRAVEAQKELIRTIKETFDDDVYYYNMWADRRLYQLTGEIPPNNFLNPIRWTEFVNRHIKDDEEN